MLVSVSCGFTPVQFEFGQPAADPDAVDGADRTAGLVVNVRFPFLHLAATRFAAHSGQRYAD